MPGRKNKQEIGQQEPEAADPAALIELLLSLRGPIEDELSLWPDAVKAPLGAVSRGIQQLGDSLDTLRRLERPDA